MPPAAQSVSGESLAAPEGVPYVGASLRPLVARTGLVAAIVALALGFAATFAAVQGTAVAGVTLDGDVIVAVDRSGFAWLNGVRPGQVVEAYRGESGAAPDGAVMVLESDGVPFESASGLYDFRLAESLPLGALGLLLALLAVAASLAGRTLGGILVMLAVLLAAESLGRLHDRWPTTIALAATVIAPTLFLGSRAWLRRPLRNAVLGVGLGFAAAWAVTRLAYVPVHEPLDGVRPQVAFYGFLAASGIELVRTLRQADLPPAVPFRLVDALFLGVSAGVIGGLLLFNGPDAVTLAAVALAVLLYPRFRRVTIRAADRLFLSDLRERAAIESAEEERARLARDIHDTSLQELAGVIGQLQGRPDTAQESEALRRVAEQLRRMSTELRPPVLDDLGLGAALAFVADRTRRPGLEVTASIDGAGIERDTRAPASVELAVFRIVEQALSNVLLHSGASRVRVGGTVAADRVEVSVRDDGRGIARADLEVAARRGRLGLASMRRRAELIGATLHVDGASGSGTTVSVRWSR